MAHDDWVDVGAAAELLRQPVQQVMPGRARVALSYCDGKFGAISGVCNHAGGPLGQGKLDGNYVVCPWHYWKFHFQTGKGEPGYEEDAVPAYEVREVDGRVLVRATASSKRSRKLHAPHPLARPVVPNTGAIRVLGISTTAMTQGQERYSTSDDLLQSALAHASGPLGCETQLVCLRELKFRACEGFYSKSARACTWPCSITQMDSEDQLDRVYEGLVHWADVILVATPIRWGAAGSLYFKMVERMNCIQNQETVAGKSLLDNKVTGFIITGGQDNVQAVAGQMLGFFAEIGCQYPQYSYIAHSRGWSAQDMENNTRYVQDSKLLHEGAGALAGRCVEMAKMLRAGAVTEAPRVRGGRKAQELDTHAQLQGTGAGRASGGE